MMRVALYERFDEVRPWRADWEALLGVYPASSSFMSWEWLSSWWAAYGAERSLRLLAGWEGDRLVGLAPLAAGRHLGSLRVLDFLGDGSYDSDHLDAPVVPGYEEAFAQAWLDTLAPWPWDVCRLNLMPEQSWIPRVLPALLERRGWWSRSAASPQAAVALPATWEGYLAQLRPSQTHHLHRYASRLTRRYQVEYHRLEEVEAGLDDLFRLHQARWQGRGEPGSFADMDRRRFYRRLAPLLGRRGDLQLWTLRLDGRTVAVQFALQYRTTVYQLQEGYAPEFAADRVGTMLRAHVLRCLIEQGVERYDYLGGFDPEKARWGAREGRYLHLRFARPWSVGGAYLWASR